MLPIPMRECGGPLELLTAGKKLSQRCTRPRKFVNVLNERRSRDTKVSRNTFVQLICFFSSGLMGTGMNTKEPEPADEPVIEIGGCQ
jgi:hypothetical protein